MWGYHMIAEIPNICRTAMAVEYNVVVPLTIQSKLLQSNAETVKKVRMR